MMKREWQTVHGPVGLFKEGGFIAIPNIYLTPEYIQQVGPEGLQFIVCLTRAYDSAGFRRGDQMQDGRLAMTDDMLADWWNLKSTSVIRKARKRVLAPSRPS
jgi:hypothetical protein